MVAADMVAGTPGDIAADMQVDALREADMCLVAAEVWPVIQQGGKAEDICRGEEGLPHPALRAELWGPLNEQVQAQCQG
jgi:hypothetical protein